MDITLEKEWPFLLTARLYPTWDFIFDKLLEITWRMLGELILLRQPFDCFFSHGRSRMCDVISPHPPLADF